MIAEPYINKKTGIIKSVEIPPKNEIGLCDIEYFSEEWQSYADFEREKLRELDGTNSIFIGTTDAFRYWRQQTEFRSERLIGYSLQDYRKDSESARLLKRAEFLKAVCEKEGVEWLPKKPQEYRLCETCRRSFPCSFEFRGVPSCRDCCCCGEPETQGTVHRKDGPCYQRSPERDIVRELCKE